MNLKSQDYLAKLLAKENLDVIHGNYQTASFDVENRVLRLPLWKDKGKAVYDLLVGHEVGHALYTPADGWHDSEKEIPGVPRDMINIIEDIRIEKKIQRTYPGITRSFKIGYKVLFDDDLFGTVGKDLKTYNFMDRLNIHSKGRGYAPVEFTDTEQLFVDLAMSVETWDDVLNACQEINDWLQNKEDYNEEQEHVQSQPGDKNEQTSEANSTQGNGDGQEIEQDNQDVESQRDEKEKSLTDQAQRDNEDDLLDTNENGKQPLYSSGISDENIDKLVIPYTKLREARLDHEATRAQYNPYIHSDLDELFDVAVKGGIQKTVNLMAKEFERKKAAWEYSRSTESKKGSLNMTKLHQYEYSEDIFLTVSQLAQAKSHGVFMLLDFSGSMNSILGDVIKQTITIAMFCKRVNIPFEAYSFTSGYTEFIQPEDIGENDIENIKSLKMVQVISSKLNKTQWTESLKHLFAVSATRTRRYESPLYYCALHPYDSMGSTPLVQALITCRPLINEMRSRTGIQNMNVMVLTDGIADDIRFSNAYSEDIDQKDIRIKFGNKIINGGSNRSEIVRNTVKLLGELTGSTMIGFFLAERKSDVTYGYRVISDDDRNIHAFSNYPDVIQNWNKNGFVSFKNMGGYSEYFIVKVGSRPDEVEFEVKENKNGKATEIKDIKRQFRNFNKSSKQSRQLVNKITDVVAA